MKTWFLQKRLQVIYRPAAFCFFKSALYDGLLPVWFRRNQMLSNEKSLLHERRIRILEYPLHAHFSEDDQKTPRRTSDPVFSARYKEHSLLRKRNIRLFSVHCRYNGHFSYNMPPVPEAVFFLPENTPPLRLSGQCKELH